MGKDPSYSIEDILLEHEMHKKQAEDRPSSPSVKEAPTVVYPPRSAVDTFRAPTPRKKAEEDTLSMDAVRVTPPKKKKAEPDTLSMKPVRVAPPTKKAEEDTLSMKPVRITDEEDTRPLSPRPAPEKAGDSTRRLDPIRAVAPAPEKTVAVSTRTRVLTVEREGERFDTHELSLPDQLEGQMVMENFVEETMDEEQLRSELQERRRQKVDGFRLIEGGQAPFKLVGDEEESDTEEELVPEEEPTEEVLEDFNEYAESDAIRSELAYRRRVGAFGVMATAVLEVLLVLLTWLYATGVLSFMSAAVLTSLHVVLLIGVLCVNHRLIAGGFKALFRLQADADTPPALCGAVGLLYTVWQFASLDTVTAGKAMFLSAAAGLCVMAGALGRQMQDMRISRNFSFVGGEKHKKYAACFVEDEKTAAELGRPATVDGIPPLAYYHKASFLTRFLEHSYSPDPSDRVMRWFTPIVLVVSLLCAVGYGLLFPAHAWQTPTVFCAVMLLCMPAWSLFAVQRTVTRSCKAALKKGVMIGGFAAIEQFGHRAKAMIVEADELFPKEQIKLHGIKTFSGTRIDDAIIDAAAVVIGANSPLAPIFTRLIENRTEILREVDSLAYEQDMGLSGWVGGRRVLIGNRRLLENHGVDVPTKEYEARYVKNDRHVVYLSTGGELSAMFVVSYLANEEIKALVRALQKQRVQLLVRSCDPNITAQLVCDVMELPPRWADVLSAGEGRAYEALQREEALTRREATLACNGRATAKLFGMMTCGRLYRATWAALITQLVLSVVFMAVSAFVSATTGLVASPLMLVGCVLMTGVVSWLVGRVLCA